MKEDKLLRVFYHDRPVGAMALTEQGRVAFQYDEGWLADGFSISPFSLPLQRDVFIAQKPYFHGLYGVFADSLPDAWGNLLLDRVLRVHGIDLGRLSVLDRLSIVASSGMGALTYRPEYPVELGQNDADLDTLCRESRVLLTSEAYGAQNKDMIDRLYRLGGTSGGARPKVTLPYEDKDWLVKFPAHTDPTDIGQMEYDYAECACACGIEMAKYRLFPSKQCKGYFGSVRFDRGADGERIHILTAAALLELDYNQPSLDYHSLMKLTKILTRNDADSLRQQFKRMCFNVYAHNRDDHAKNFSFFYEEKRDRWRLCPAYDLTYSSTYFGEHTTSVDGNGVSPGRTEILAVAKQAGLPVKEADTLRQEVEDTVSRMLGRYLKI